MSKRGYIEVKLPRCLIVLTDPEFNKLLQKDPEVWERAIRRGKAVMRTRASQAREARKGRMMV